MLRKLRVGVFLVHNMYAKITIWKKNNEFFENVATWKHLGTALTNQNCVYGEIKSRTCSGNACYPSVQKLSSSRLPSKGIKDSNTRSYHFSCCLTDVWKSASHLCCLSCAHSYIHRINQRMRSIKYNKTQITKYNSLQVSQSYMFRHRSAILRESTRTKEYKSDTQIPFF
jgi:hypothetical protein